MGKQYLQPTPSTVRWWCNGSKILPLFFFYSPRKRISGLKKYFFEIVTSDNRHFMIRVKVRQSQLRKFAHITLRRSENNNLGYAGKYCNIISLQ